MSSTISTPESRLLRNRSLEKSSVKVTVPAGETSPWIPTPDLAVVVVSPGVGGTMLAQATFSLPSVVDADNANGTSNAVSLDWDNGTVSVASAQLLEMATAVRFVATGAAGVGEVAR